MSVTGRKKTYTGHNRNLINRIVNIGISGNLPDASPFLKCNILSQSLTPMTMSEMEGNKLPRFSTEVVRETLKIPPSEGSLKKMRWRGETSPRKAPVKAPMAGGFRKLEIKFRRDWRDVGSMEK